MALRVLSGGQTGVDQAALRAARACGLETGGRATPGWETEDGPSRWLADFGLVESPEPGHPATRRGNSAEADTMILLGGRSSPDLSGAMEDWGRVRHHAPFLWVDPWASGPGPIVRFLRGGRRDGRRFGSVLVCGTRESEDPGVGARAERLLVAVFRQVAWG